MSDDVREQEERPGRGVCEVCGERALFADERRCWRHPLRGEREETA